MRYFEAHAPVALAPDPELNAALRRARQGAAWCWPSPRPSPAPRPSSRWPTSAPRARSPVLCTEEDGDPVAAARAALEAPDAPVVADRAALDAALATV